MQNEDLIKIIDFINDELNDEENNAINEVLKLSSFIDSIDIFLNFEMASKLLEKSEKLNKIIGNIVQNNIDKIKINKVNELFSDQTLIRLVRAYCLINDIKKDNSDAFIGDVTLADSFQMYVQSISKIPVLSKEEERDLMIRIKAGDEIAKSEFIMRNLKLVLSIAKRYTNCGMELSDIVEYGNIGLIKAVEKFDLNKDCRFSTYAAWWIKHKITRSLSNYSRTIVLPVSYYSSNVSNYKKCRDELIEKLGRDPTPFELAEFSNLSLEKIEDTYMTLNEVDLLSIDSYIEDENGNKLNKSNIISSNDMLLEDKVTDNCLTQEIYDFLKSINLSDDDIKILAYRYGYYGGIGLTLEKIAQIYGVTRETINKRIQKSLNKIRLSKGILGYANLMDNPEKSLAKMHEYVLEYNNKKLIRSDNMRKNNIFKYYKGRFTKKEILNALKQLSPEDMAIYCKRYGTNLDSPVCNTGMTRKEVMYVNKELYPKIETILEKQRNVQVKVKVRN